MLFLSTIDLTPLWAVTLTAVSSETKLATSFRGLMGQAPDPRIVQGDCDDGTSRIWGPIATRDMKHGFSCGTAL
jgi:hypothetical protein